MNLDRIKTTLGDHGTTIGRLNRDCAVLAVRGLVKLARAEMPEVSFIKLDYTDQGGDHRTATGYCDADLKEVYLSHEQELVVDNDLDDLCEWLNDGNGEVWKPFTQRQNPGTSSNVLLLDLAKAAEALLPQEVQAG